MTSERVRESESVERERENVRVRVRVSVSVREGMCENERRKWECDRDLFSLSYRVTLPLHSEDSLRSQFLSSWRWEEGEARKGRHAE